ncbi:MAG: right-handed parallel beta-helix repeat-containing protein [Vicinamibacteria bacterium]
MSRLVLGLFLLAAAPAGAATYHVAPTGGGAACSQAAPCREIGQALLLVAPGDTVLVADGSYLGFDVDDIDGLPGQPITIRATGSGAVVTAAAARPDSIFIRLSDWIVIDGLRASNASVGGVRAIDSRHLTIRNGVFGNNGERGIFAGFAEDLVLENNECFGSVSGSGISVTNSGDRPVVRGNRLHGNAASGLQFNADASGGGDGLITGALVENNVIHGNGAAGGAGVTMDGLQDATVRNNLLYDNHASGIAAYRIDGAEGPRGLRILHNTIDQAANGRWALTLANTAGPNLVRNNVLFNRHPARGSIAYATATDVANTDSDYNVMDRVTPDDDVTVYDLAQWQAQGHEPHSALPGLLGALFVNPNAGDYRLPALSPAVDLGQALTGVAVDIEGNPRPQGASSDAGSYERAGALAPTLAVAGASIAEGNAGTTTLSFAVTLSAAAAQSVTVAFATASGTATAPADYAAASGVLTFPPGATARTVTVLVAGDVLVEGDEAFAVGLSSPSGAIVADGPAAGTIVDDDLPPIGGLELSHGAVVAQDLSAATGTAGTDTYRIAQQPRSSYEVVVDGASGDVSPVVLDRLAANGSAVLQTGDAAGTGTARSLRWANTATTPVLAQAVRVGSGGCTAACGPDDIYRVRAWDTTGAVPRFNQSGSQGTVLVLQNRTPRTVSGRIYFWSAAGTLAGESPLALPPRATSVLSLATVAGLAGKSGSITIAHDGGYGALAGKAVALEPSTGFSFDSPLTDRAR